MSGRIIGLIVAAMVITGALGGGVILLTRRTPTPTAPPAPIKDEPKSDTPTTTTNEPTISSNSILSADTAKAAEDSKKRFASAMDKIKQWSLWKPDAQFSGLFMSFGPTLLLDSANEVYVFDSPSDQDHHYTVSVAQSSGNILRAYIPLADYQGALLPIKPEYWQSNYVEAVQFTYNNGGKEFMAANTTTGVDVSLIRATPNNYLYWVVTYNTKDPSVTLAVKMDAKDKTLVKD